MNKLRSPLFLLATALLAALAQYFVAWQMVMVVPFLLALILKEKPLKSFALGFFSIFSFWIIRIFIVDIPNNHLLSSKMGVLFHINEYSVFITVNAMFGGLLGGLASLAGALIMIKPRTALAKHFHRRAT